MVHHPSAETALVGLLVSAMRDEISDVRRGALGVARLIAKAWPRAALAQLLPHILLPAAEALSDVSAPTKAAAERVVYRICLQGGGLEQAQAMVSAAGGAALRSKLTDTVLRRLQREVVDSEDDESAS
jgi:hypothetical protein